jgi:tetratricopeptide (TPR) repeat protein
MNQTQILSLLAIRRIHSRAVAPTLAWKSGDDVEFNSNDSPFLGSEDRQGLGRSLRRAVERAWLSIELVLARDLLAPKLGPPGQRMLAALVANRCFDYLSGTPAPFRHAIWRELHAAREAGPLEQGEVDVDALSDEIGQLTQPMESEQVQEAEWQALFKLADDLGREGCGGLRSLLEAHSENGESLLVCLVLSFLPYELELEGARFSDHERSSIPAEQILWLTEQSEPLEELLADMSHGGAPATHTRVEIQESAESAARVRQGLSYSQRGDYERAAVEFTAVLHNGQARPNVYVHRGDAYRLRGDYDRAVADYSAALRLDPSLVLALVNRAMVQRLIGRPEAAIADYSEAIRLDPRNVIAYNGRGAAHADLSQFDRAVADHTQALRLDPALAWAHQSRGDAYAGLGDYDLAIADYSHALRLNPHLPLAHTNRGDAYRLKGDLDRSIADYTEALRLDPLNPRVFANRGESYRRKGEFNRALADFSEAIRVDPTNPAVYLSRGIAYQLAGEHDRAVADFDRAEQFDSANPAVFYQRALTYQKEGSYDRAMADLGKAIELNPRDTAAYLSRGALRALISKSDGAIDDFTEAIRLDPSSPQARLERGRVYAQTFKFEPALEDCAAALRLDSNFVPAYVVRGGTLLRMGEYGRAIVELNEALRINPRYSKAYNDRGVAYSKLERLDEAIADFGRALQFAPEYVQALANRANAYQLQKQHFRALKDFTQAVQLDIKYASAYCVQRGLVESARRQYDQAMADYTVALVIDPDCIPAQKGLWEAKQLRESDFAVVEEEPKHPDTKVSEAPTQTARAVPTQTNLPAVRVGKAPETQLAMPAVKSDFEIALAQQSSAGQHPAVSVGEDPGADGDEAVTDEEAGGATANAEAEYVPNAAVEVDEADSNRTEEFPERESIRMREVQLNALAIEAQRRFESSKLKAEKSKKYQRVDPEEREERLKRYKQFVMVGIGVIVLGYWGVKLVMALIPPPANPFDEYQAEQFLNEYVKNKVAADEKYADKMVSVRGKVVVEIDKKKRAAPRIFAAAKTDGMRIEYEIGDEEQRLSMKDGEEYLIAGKVLPFQPGKGIVLIDAHIRVDPKKRSQVDSPDVMFALAHQLPEQLLTTNGQISPKEQPIFIGSTHGNIKTAQPRRIAREESTSR